MKTVVPYRLTSMMWSINEEIALFNDKLMAGSLSMTSLKIA